MRTIWNSSRQAAEGVRRVFAIGIMAVCVCTFAFHSAVRGDETEAAEETKAADESPKPQSNSPSKDNPPLPKFDEIEKAVEKHFESQRGYKAGDLLTSKDAPAVFKKVESLGWKVADRKEIEKQFLPETDWLVKQLRTDDGQKFMREIARNPSGFDRIDRMRKMPYGDRQLVDLIHSPEGYKMIEYMTTTPGGKNLGKSLSQGKQGKDFNEPTGRIYTEKQFLERLKQSHKEASKPPAKKR